MKLSAQNKWNSRNRHKLRAHSVVKVALRNGTLRREPCWCGAPAEAHHPDYNEPLKVVWLCRKHHQRLHAALRKRARSRGAAR